MISVLVNKTENISFFTSVYAGFASPAEDHYEEQLNLNTLLIEKPLTTSIYYALDSAMFSSGIFEGDVLVVDESVKNPLGKVVVAKVEDEVHIKRLSMIKNELFLTTDSLKYTPLRLEKEMDYKILGVVKYSIHNLLSPSIGNSIKPDIDLHSYLIDRPVSTFFVRVSGHSMINAGIYDHDILIVDKSLHPSLDNIVIAYLDGGFTVKRLKKNKVNLILFPENDDFPPIELTEEMDSRFWGVATYSIHRVL